MTAPPIVIVGGGIAGVEVARRVRARDAAVAITIVDPAADLVYRPWLIHVPSQGRDVAQLRLPLDQIARRHGATLVAQRVARIAHDEHLLVLDDGTTIEFTRVVIAAGATSDRAAVPGAADHALFPCETRDAIALRDVVERDDVRAITFVVGGQRPGPGVEFAAAIAEHVQRTGRKLRVTLIDPGPSVLAQLGARASARMTRWLIELGVDVRVGVAVAAIDADAVRLTDGARVPSDVTAVVGPLRGTDVGIDPAFLDEGGFVPVTWGMRSVVDRDVLACGDIAAPPGPLPKAMVLARLQAPTVGANALAADADEDAVFPFERAGRFALSMPDVGGRTALVHVPSQRLLAAGRTVTKFRAVVDRGFMRAHT